MTGIALYKPSKSSNFDSIMRLAFNFSADFVCTISKRYKRGAADTTNTAKQVPVFHFDNSGDFFLNTPRNCIKIALEIDDRATNLEKFYHPKDAIYIFGGEMSFDRLPNAFLEQCPIKLKLKTNRCLNLAMCAGMTLFHRHLQNYKS